MDYHESQELISAYLDGALSPKEKAEAERLLDASSELRADLDDFARISELLRGLPRESAPPELAAAVRHQARAKALLSSELVAPRRSLRREFVSGLVGAAATIAAVIVFLPALQRKEPQELMVGISDRTSGIAPAQRPAEELALFAQGESGRIAEGQEFGAAALRRESSEAEGLYEAKSPAEMPSAPAPAATANASPEDESNGTKLAADFDADGIAPMTAALKRGIDGRVLASGVSPEAIRIGDLLPYFEKNADGVSVVELTVLDKQQCADQIELLCKRSQFSVIPDGAVFTKETLADPDIRRSKDNAAQKSGEPSSGESDVMLLYLQASRDNMADLLQGLDEHAELYVGARVQPPVEAPADSEATLPQKIAENSEADLAENEVEVAKTEANAVVKNYALQQRQYLELEEAPESNSDDFYRGGKQRKGEASRRMRRNAEGKTIKAKTEPVAAPGGPVDALIAQNDPDSQWIMTRQNAIAVQMHFADEIQAEVEDPEAQKKLSGVDNPTAPAETRFLTSRSAAPNGAVPQGAFRQRVDEPVANPTVRVLLVVKQVREE
jgi:hypothetical protein